MKFNQPPRACRALATIFSATLAAAQHTTTYAMYHGYLGAVAERRKSAGSFQDIFFNNVKISSPIFLPQLDWTGALARLSAGPNGVTPRTLLPALSVPVTSFPPPPQPSHHAHALTSRGMMMGLPVKGHPLRRVHQLPVAKGTRATVAAAPTWKRTLPAPSGSASPLEPLDTLSYVKEGFTRKEESDFT